MNDDVRKLLAGYVDGELTDEEKTRVERELEHNQELRAELGEFRSLKEITGMVTYADLPDEVWDTYWLSLYRKLERGLGWILFSLGAILLFCFGIFMGFKRLYLDPDIHLLVKIGITGLTAGGVILLVSFARERLFAYKRDRYGRVNR